MKIIPIFGDHLYSAHYDEKEIQDEFDRLFDCWQDPQFLEDFFNKHEQDLKSGFFGNLTIEDAVILTRQEAIRLENDFIQFATLPGKSLDACFQPLDKALSTDPIFQKQKARGRGNKSWLRVYAIKIGAGVYLVTGGAIKLTRKMGEREHTKQELRKLQRCLSFLNDEGISSEEGFFELVNE